MRGERVTRTISRRLALSLLVGLVAPACGAGDREAAAAGASALNRCGQEMQYPTGSSVVLTKDCSGLNEIVLGVPADDGSVRELDHVVIRALKPGETFLSGPYCYDARDSEVMLSAIFRWPKTPAMRPAREVIVEAWIPDATSSRFEKVTPQQWQDWRCAQDEGE